MILICALPICKRIVNKCSIYATLPAPSVQQLRCGITAGDYFVSKQSRENLKNIPMSQRIISVSCTCQGMRSRRSISMKTRALFLSFILALGVSLPSSASASDDNQKKDDQKQQAQTPATDDQSQTQNSKEAKPKHDGGKDDVDAIGNRKLGGMDWYSIEKEVRMGKEFAQQIEQSMRMVQDPVVNEYINRIGQNLVRNSDAKVPFTIKVVDSDEVNAFALPGGFFYVNSGLILAADEEAELAGVMAHEIAHVAARHATRQMTRANIANLMSIPAMIFIPYTMAGYALYQGLNMAIPLTFLKFSRDAEREADFLGIQYMYKAGYDPNSYVTFFERVQADEKRRPGTIPKVFSTHPPTPERIANTQKEIARILPARQEYIVTTSAFDQVKGRLRNIMFSRNLTETKDRLTHPAKTEQSKKQPTGNDPNSTTDDDRPTLKRRPDSQP